MIVQVVFRVDQKIKASIYALAKRKGCTMSKLAGEAIELYCAKSKGDKRKPK
jgi:hypothetical protein